MLPLVSSVLSRFASLINAGNLTGFLRLERQRASKTHEESVRELLCGVRSVMTERLFLE